MPRITAVLLTLCLAGCGLKGALVLPPGPAPAPLFGNPKPAPAPAKTTEPATAENGEADVSTDKKNTTE
jgi:hypothetical protein